VIAVSLFKGSLRVTDVDDLTVGTVGLYDGLRVADFGMIATLITGGPITLAKDVLCENAVFQPTAGGVVQTGGVVKGRTLALLGSGQFVLTQLGNDVTGIAANVTGPVTYSDANALQVVTFRPGINEVRGIKTAGGAVSLTTGGNLSIGGYLDNAAINAGPSGLVNLRAGGSVAGGIDAIPYPMPGVWPENSPSWPGPASVHC
jgi:hypothetical protein